MKCPPRPHQLRHRPAASAADWFSFAGCQVASVRCVRQPLLKANGVEHGQAGTALVQHSLRESLDKLREEKLDAVFFVLSAESPLIRKLLQDENLVPLSLELAGRHQVCHRRDQLNVLRGQVQLQVDHASGEHHAFHERRPRNADVILQLWKDSGIDTRTHLSFLCGGGWRAAEVLTFAQVMELEKASLYSDGWIGWSNDRKNPIETGPVAAPGRCSQPTSDVFLGSVFENWRACISQ